MYTAHSVAGGGSVNDAVLLGPWLAAVADGHGTGGALAAKITVDTFAQLNTSARPSDLPAALRDAVADAQQRMQAAAADVPHHYADMSAMFTALVSHSDQLGLAHLGNGCAYLLREDELFRITPEEPTWCVVRAWGPDDAPTPTPTRSRGELSASGDRPDSLYVRVRRAFVGDRYLLCPYGLAGSIDDHAKNRILGGASGPADAARRLINGAMGVYNRPALTAVVVDVVETPPTYETVALGAAARARPTHP